jgi:hypothetical protein
MEDTVVTADVGNGNEPPAAALAPSADVAPAPTDVPDSSQSAPSVNSAHDWLDVLVAEFQNLDEVAKNRLHHIVEQIRSAL